MEMFKSMAMQLPMLIACLVFVVAAAKKIGREKGAVLVMAGAIGMVFLTIAGPIIHVGIMGRLIENMQVEEVPFLFLIISLVTNLFWTVAIALVAIGTFKRPSPMGER